MHSLHENNNNEDNQKNADTARRRGQGRIRLVK